MITNNKNELEFIVDLVIKNEFLNDCIRKMYFIGKGNNNGLPNDLDFVAFINDNVSRYKFIKFFTAAIQEHILFRKILISCFPIHSKHMKFGNSMFIDNVLKHGKEIIK